ncbi:MAG: hypothetical protein Gyms2KO_03380 [Gymnodinialimonas sp.]
MVQTLLRRMPGWLFDVPLLGSVLRRSHTIELSRGISMLLRSGMQIVPAIDTYAATATKSFSADVLTAAANSIKDGGQLQDAFNEPKYVDPMLIGILELASTANRLAELLDVVANALERERVDRNDRLIQLLSPILTLIIGAVIGALVLSTISSIMALNDVAF